MANPDPSITAAEFASLARHAGLTLTDTQRETLYAVYGHFERMKTLVRGTRDRGAEPAHIFVPGQEWDRP